MRTVNIYYNVVTKRLHRVIETIQSNGVEITLIDIRKEFFSFEEFLLILQEVDDVKHILKKTPHIVEWYESEEIQSLSLFELHQELMDRPTFLTPYFFRSGQKVLVGLSEDQLTMFYPRTHRVEQIEQVLQQEDAFLVES